MQIVASSGPSSQPSPRRGGGARVAAVLRFRAFSTLIRRPGGPEFQAHAHALLRPYP